MKKILALLCIFGAFLALPACSTNGAPDYTAPVSSQSSTSTSSVAITKSALQFSETTNVTATFLNSNGTPATGITVNFSTTLGTLNPASGNVTTDANGQATIQLTAGTVSGQGSVTATASINNKAVIKSATYSVQLPTLTLSTITVPTTAISYGASATVSVSVLDANGAVYKDQDVFVTFTSTQTAAGTASINSPIKTVGGVATTTYTAISFSGTDTITASISGSSKTATISVNPLSTSSIQFISASPAQIGLSGVSNGLPEISKVTFEVVDSAGNPKPNVGVSFSLNTNVGGITLTGITNTSTTTGTGSTDSKGMVSVNVLSGTIATSVRVTATVTGTTISTQSDELVIATGLPAQDAMSISLSNMNSESWETDGITVTATARLADHFKNPVSGVSVYFTTSGGSIDPYCITGTTGACSVTWRSQAPRPLLYNVTTNPDGPPRSGQVTILAYAIGEEGFLDSNGNGVADGSCTPITDGTGLAPSRTCGEFTDWSEAFLDQNWNGVRDSFETFIDFNQDGVFNGPDGYYNGVLQGAATLNAGFVVPKSKHIFINTYMVMSGSFANIVFNGAYSMGTNTSESRSFTVSDENGNTMPSGTVITFSGANGLTVSPGSVTVPQNIGGAATYGVVISNASSTAGGGILTIDVKTPAGVDTALAVPITWP